MNNFLILILIAALSALLAGCPARPAGLKYPNGKFLGNIFRTGAMPLYFDKFWNQVTPENAGKWGSAEPEMNYFVWTDLDPVYQFAKSKGIPFKMHNLIWGQQQPYWINSLSPAGQEKAIIEWISKVGARYPGMDFIDVVNEPIHNPPSYSNAMGGSGSTGWDWVVFAFMQARKYCRGKLLINDYNIENDEVKCAEYTNIIMILKAENLIDGIGVECHGTELESVSLATLSNCLGMMAATGLPVYISELDLTNASDDIQESIYRKFFPIFWNYGDVRGVTLWGYIKGEMWRSYGWLLDANGVPRPALVWLTNYVRGGAD